MVLTRTGWVVLAALAGTLAVGWRAGGDEWWRRHTDDRLLYGVPWGTLLTVAGVVAFYLVAQTGLTHWNDPLTLPFRTWSYLYPTGLLTAGVAHGSPAHIVGNMAGTVAFGVVAEYAWGHYPPAERDDATLLASGSGDLLTRPLVRVAAVPVAMLAAAFVTSLFSLGATLGFSGAVFAIAGFAVVTRPLAGVLAVVGSSAARLLFEAVSNPIVRATAEAGAPGPPSWARIAFQAHMLGFAIGVVLAVALLRSRSRRPEPVRVLFGTGAFGLAQSQWLISWSSGEEFVLYRGVGVVVVCLWTLAVTVAASGSDRPLLGERDAGTRTGVRVLAALWLALVALLLAGVVALGFLRADYGPGTVFLLATLLALLALPAVPPVLPERWGGDTLTRRGTALGVLCVLAVVLAVPGVITGPVAVDGDHVRDTGEVTVGDYTVTYAEDVTDGRRLLLGFGNDSVFGNSSGVVVVSERRQLWTVPESPGDLERAGNVSVTVGGLGSRTTVYASRTGWDVTGNDSAYAVDLVVDGERTRSFTSDPARADLRLDGHSVTVVPTAEGFDLRVERNGTPVGTAAMPEANGTVAVDPLSFTRENGSVVAESDGSRATVAERES